MSFDDVNNCVVAAAADFADDGDDSGVVAGGVATVGSSVGTNLLVSYNRLFKLSSNSMSINI